MKVAFSLVTCTLATAGFALGGVNPLAADPNSPAKRVVARGENPQSDVDALISTVRVHTANINTTLSGLPTVNLTAALNITATGNSSNANVTAELSEIAAALNSSAGGAAAAAAAAAGPAGRSVPLLGRRDDTVTCDPACQQGVFGGFGNLSAEISFTLAGCIKKNAVDLTSSSSVVITVVSALADAADDFGDNSVGSLSGVVVQNLLAALGTEIGGALASIVAGP